MRGHFGSPRQLELRGHFVSGLYRMVRRHTYRSKFEEKQCYGGPKFTTISIGWVLIKSYLEWLMQVEFREYCMARKYKKKLVCIEKMKKIRLNHIKIWGHILKMQIKRLASIKSHWKATCKMYYNSYYSKWW